jgi:hypothetical protein
MTVRHPKGKLLPTGNLPQTKQAHLGHIGSLLGSSYEGGQEGSVATGAGCRKAGVTSTKDNYENVQKPA